MIEGYRTKQIALVNIAVEQAAQIVAYGLIVNLSYTNEGLEEHSRTTIRHLSNLC